MMNDYLVRYFNGLALGFVIAAFSDFVAASTIRKLSRKLLVTHIDSKVVSLKPLSSWTKPSLRQRGIEGLSIRQDGFGIWFCAR